MQKSRDAISIATSLDRIAARKLEAGATDTAATVAHGAAAIRLVHRRFVDEYKRAELLVRENASLRTRLAALQAENTQLKSDVLALQAVAGRPERVVAQTVERDSNQEIRRVTYAYENEKQRIGFA